MTDKNVSHLDRDWRAGWVSFREVAARVLSVDAADREGRGEVTLVARFSAHHWAAHAGDKRRPFRAPRTTPGYFYQAERPDGSREEERYFGMEGPFSASVLMRILTQ